MSTRRNLILSCIAALLFLHTQLDAAEKLSLDANMWQVHTGFENAWTEPGFKPGTESGWFLRKTGELKVTSFPGVTKGSGNASYTFHTTFRAPALLRNSTNALGLFIPGIGEAWEVYVNGSCVEDQLFCDAGGEITLNRTVRGVLINFSPALLREGDNSLVIRVTGNPGFWGTGLYLYPGVEIGRYDRLHVEKSELIIFILISFYAMAGLYHLFLFIRRRHERYNLYYGIFSILVFTYFFARTNSIFELFGPADLILRIEYMVVFSLFPLLLAFVESLLREKQGLSRLNIGYAVFCGVLIAAMPLVPLRFTSVVLTAWQASVPLPLGYGVFIIISAVRRNVKEGYYLLGGMVVCIFTIAFDILDFMFFGTGLAFTKYALFILVSGIALILAEKFMRVYRDVEDLNVNLERKVTERTDELTRTLDEIRDLKFRQDGDYYLTALLVNPMGRNDVESKNVRVHAFARQYKQFTFSKFGVEIGGDLNIATRIRLHGRYYVSFLNCDAMGKSIQGAGGALITGVIFHSFLNRTRDSVVYRESFPEQWLYECFNEFERMFTSLEGNMYISLVMGLVDEESGFMYYVNAAHPFPVLYREGKARFIDEEPSIHKIGMEVEEDIFRLVTCQLNPGDVVIVGSDGRDDVILGVDESGNRIINENEKLFLSHVEKGRGNLEEIVGNIMRAGELSDDLSLLGITFEPIGNYQYISFKYGDVIGPEIDRSLKSAHELADKGNLDDALSLLKTAKDKFNSHPVILREIIRMYVKAGRIDEAAGLVEEFSTLSPGDNELLYLASYIFKQGRLLEPAQIYGERCRLRDPRNAKNLLNLADVYRALGDTKKALHYLNGGLALDPHNKAGLKLKQLLGFR